MTRQELEIKAKEFDFKLKRHPMSSEELQKVLCDFVEALRQTPVSGRSEQFYCVSSNALVYGKPCEKWCGDDNCTALCKQ